MAQAGSGGGERARRATQGLGASRSAETWDRFSARSGDGSEHRVSAETWERLLARAGEARRGEARFHGNVDHFSTRAGTSWSIVFPPKRVPFLGAWGRGRGAAG